MAHPIDRRDTAGAGNRPVACCLYRADRTFKCARDPRTPPVREIHDEGGARLIGIERILFMTRLEVAVLIPRPIRRSWRTGDLDKPHA